ncbi:MAG: hypothetical protein LBK00_06065 [Treponema sp.]|jgi:hypothetical protein|nr:hypothetical protein [Treponema sp.]
MPPAGVSSGIKYMFLCVSVFLLLSCQNEAHWYPNAEVSVSSHTEYTGLTASAKALAVTLLTHNTGDTSIVSSALTVRTLTDKREYLHTVSSTLRIIPAAKSRSPRPFPILRPRAAQGGRR